MTEYKSVETEMQELDDAIKNVSATEYLFNTLLNDMMKPLY